ncbi:MAG: recombinase family protein [Blautia sp.]|nr:recombinase family protein [Blautia sp.]
MKKSSMPDYRTGALYIRVSTDKQEELSPDAQKRLLLDYAKKNKILIKPEHIFIENGISGRNADKRPEFQHMISLAKSKPSPFNTILLWKFSRFARNQEESIVYKSMLRKQCNVDVISITEPLIDGPFGSLIERIIEWMDEYYSINLSGEVIRGMTEKAMRGGYQTTPPLGYRAVGGGKPFEVVPEEAKIVKYIFDQYCNFHKEQTAIARQLNDMGIRTKRGGPFEKRNILYILKNPFYVGELEWNGIKSKGTHETFISPELFHKAQDIYNETFKPARRRSVSSCKHWLSGIVKCSTCGASLAFNVNRRGSAFFNCWKYAKGFHKGSSGISERKLINGILEYFEKILNGAEFTFSYIPKESEEDACEETYYKIELEKLAGREQRIKYAYESGVDSLEEYKENKKRLLDERKRLEDLLSEIKKEPQVMTKENYLSKVQTVYDIIKNEEIDYEVKGAFMRSIVEEIIFDKESNTLTFHLYSS